MAAELLILAGAVALVAVVVMVLSGRAERTNIQHNVGDIDPGI